ncbi:MAG: Sapep family Mn(2+)-dependent dipeptidase [Clostridia bacterium]|nr:Sapep family Mn(2+)-dependent dipeptidase [Clostridia bacterium]
MNKALCDHIDNQRARFVKDLARLVAVDSTRTAPLPGMPFGEGGAIALGAAAEILSQHGYEPVNYENYALEADFGDAPDLLFLAHLDVVPAGDDWTYEPFSMTEEGDRVYGRGVTDDKGPALAALLAMDACRDVLGQPKTGVRLVLGSGEETGSEDMQHYFSRRPALRYTVSPDASFPLINLEKGRFAPTFKKKAVSEAFIRVKEICGGATQNIVPGKATALISHLNAKNVAALVGEAAARLGVEARLENRGEDLSILVKGTPAHASTPEAGVNAQTALIRILLALPLRSDPVRETLEGLARLFPHGDTKGEALGIDMADDESGALTLNFGVLSYDGETFACGADLRLPLAATEGNVKDPMAEKLASIDFAFEGDPELRPVHYVPPTSPLVKTCLAAYEEFTGQPGECLAIGGGTYVHDVPGGVAFGPEFPGRDYRIHGADEYADVPELLLSAKIYAEVIARLCY